jgi:hypothetical protein
MRLLTVAQSVGRHFHDLLLLHAHPKCLFIPGTVPISVSRACLGKMMIFILKRGDKSHFSYLHTPRVQHLVQVPAPVNIGVKTAEISAIRVS